MSTCLSCITSISHHVRDLFKVPYPGKRAEFALVKDWNEVEFNERFPLVRSHNFLSQTADSFFSEAKILGYENGNITLYVEFQKDKQRLAERYFSDHEIKLDSLFVHEGEHHAKTLPEKRSLLNILIKHNSFPKEQIPFMQSLIEAENWYTVTPLQEEQRFI
ncbi:MAG TPA: hypothetical protein VLG49_08100 [Rhabdochlamydiaceae bacterium]|nr:hypothetical protein [Rhabdochlamydiaceae bacterium]